MFGGSPNFNYVDPRRAAPLGANGVGNFVPAAGLPRSDVIAHRKAPQPPLVDFRKRYVTPFIRHRLQDYSGHVPGLYQHETWRDRCPDRSTYIYKPIPKMRPKNHKKGSKAFSSPRASRLVGRNRTALFARFVAALQAASKQNAGTESPTRAVATSSITRRRRFRAALRAFSELVPAPAPTASRKHRAV